MPNFEVLDARIASALNKFIHNSHFKRRISLEEQKAQRFHTIYSTRRKSSRRIYVVQGEIDEKTAYIQARSSVARALEVNGKECQAEGKAKMV